MQGYRELVIEGPEPAVSAFLLGLKLGKGWSGGFLLSSRCGVKGESRGHKLLEKLHVEKQLTYVLVPDRQADAVVESLRQARQDLGLVLRRDRPVAGAEFAYQFQSFSRAVGAKIRRLFNNLPKEIEVVSGEENEEVRPKSKGVEVYAPDHEYVYTGKGTIRGPLDAVLEFRNRLQSLEWIKAEQVQLDLG